jgi:ABC-type branched-subunit amino acid transport system substrate-binding protein
VRKRLWQIVLVFVAALALGACGGDDESTDEPAATGADTTVEESKAPEFELRLGALMPLTGDLASFGQPMAATIDLAMGEIRSALQECGYNGITANLLSVEDEQGEAQAAVEAATKLVQSDDADVLIGTLSSTTTIPVAQSVAIPNSVVHVVPLPSAPQITDLDDDDLVWRVGPSDALQAEVLVETVADVLGADATVNVGARNDAFGTALKDLFESKWQEGGGQIGESLSWNADAPNLNTEAQQLARGNPDGWVIIDFTETYAKLAPALIRAGGWTPEKTFVTNSMRSEEALNALDDRITEGLRGVSPISTGAPGREAFDALVKESGDFTPTGFEGATFDSVILPFLAAVAAGSSEPSEIAQHMQEVSGPPGTAYTFENLCQAMKDLVAGEDIDYQGTFGPIDWDENGDPSSVQFELWEMRDDKISTIDTFSFDRD